MIKYPRYRNHSDNREGVTIVIHQIIDFFSSIAAGVCTYIICKWLEKDKRLQSENPEATTLGFLFCDYSDSSDVFSTTSCYHGI
jgi:hypothetical protein